jgi:hypothetical protein
MELKIRNLVQDPAKIDLCLQDLIFKLTSCAESLSILEHKNTKTALDNVKRELGEFKKLYIEFEQRIRGKVTYEVMDVVSRDTRRHGNPDKITEHNEFMKKVKNNLDSM